MRRIASPCSEVAGVPASTCVASASGSMGAAEVAGEFALGECGVVCDPAEVRAAVPCVAGEALSTDMAQVLNTVQLNASDVRFVSWLRRTALPSFTLRNLSSTMYILRCDLDNIVRSLSTQ